MNCSVPVVTVSSVYVPSPTAVQAPVTCSDPVIGAEVQPAPTTDGSSVPLTVRQDEVTVQVPTTLPPQAVTFEQDAPAPPDAEIPPPAAPPLPSLPPVPDVVPDPEPHPEKAGPSPTAIASTTSARCLFPIFTICRPAPFRAAETFRPNRGGDFYGIPTNVVTLCALSVTLTRDCETLTAEPWPRLLLADVS
jgi:hypothetical protein